MQKRQVMENNRMIVDQIPNYKMVGNEKLLRIEVVDIISLNIDVRDLNVSIVLVIEKN